MEFYCAHDQKSFPGTIIEGSKLKTLVAHKKDRCCTYTDIQLQGDLIKREEGRVDNLVKILKSRVGWGDNNLNLVEASKICQKDMPKLGKSNDTRNHKFTVLVMNSKQSRDYFFQIGG